MSGRLCWSGRCPEPGPRLRLEGITYGGKVQLATVSGKMLAVGETALIPGTRPLKIQKDSVVVAVDGEDQPRRLLIP